MKIKFKKSVFCILFLFFPNLIFSQTLELGTLSSFEAYTGSGAATNSGTFTGDIGSDLGIISGFTGPSFSGTIYNNDAVTKQAKIDLLRVYIQLCNVFVTHPGTHTPAFGSGETITPGVYSIGGAGSVAGTLTLDGGGDADAFFIMKFEGAFSIGSNSTIVLSNGTKACNVFWIAEGAIDDAGASIIKGTLLSHPGAITLGANSEIEGRILSTDGEITISSNAMAIAPACISTIPIICSGSCAPAVDVLGTAGDFTLFTSIGDVTNTGISGVIGHVGTDNGTVSGFSSSTRVGTYYDTDATTAQAKIDLEDGYNQLMLIPNTVTGHAPAFGSGETVTPGVYSIGAAGSLAGTIILDGQNNPDPIFIFKFSGAFSVAAQSKVIFINGTRLCNVFWISEGATIMGTFTYMKGTVIAHAGACTMAANGNIEGRMLSTDGAIGFSTGVAYNQSLCSGTINEPYALPIELLSFTAESEGVNVQLNWITTAEINNDYFKVERSNDGVNFTSISKVDGAGNSTQTLSYSTIDNRPLDGISYYRLKQTDYDGKTTYSNTETIEFNKMNELILDIYPNPFSGKTVFNTTEKLKAASLIVYNSYGQLVKQVSNISGRKFTFHREDLSNGLYYFNLVQNSRIIATNKLVITD